MHTHSQHLERWLGVDAVKTLTASMLDWYGPPIALHGVPGKVYACKGGDFIGPIEAGSEVSALERADTLLRRSDRARRILRGIQRKQSGGFADLTALREAARTGKREDFSIVRSTNVGAQSNQSVELWYANGGAVGAAAPGGTAHVNADSTINFDNVSTETRHLVSAEMMCNLSGHNLLLYDRLFSVAKTMNDTGTEAVTGVPTRYQSTTATDQDYIGGNFLSVEVVTADLPATAHNWTVCTYLDQANAASTLPSFAGRASAVRYGIDQGSFRWFAALADGDVGIKALTQMQCDAAVASGTIDFVIGHPIAWMTCILANLVCLHDGINTAFNLVRIFDGACLSFIEINKPNSTTSVYRGNLTFVHS